MTLSFLYIEKLNSFYLNSWLKEYIKNTWSPIGCGGGVEVSLHSLIIIYGKYCNVLLLLKLFIYFLEVSEEYLVGLFDFSYIMEIFKSYKSNSLDYILKILKIIVLACLRVFSFKGRGYKFSVLNLDIYFR